ncbi:MAG: hypothetical protein AVDCRST_MAG25-2961, partial [uncultured Rubrobacteraceae bacterium]
DPSTAPPHKHSACSASRCLLSGSFLPLNHLESRCRNAEGHRHPGRASAV